MQSYFKIDLQLLQVLRSYCKSGVRVILKPIIETKRTISETRAYRQHTDGKSPDLKLSDWLRTKFYCTLCWTKIFDIYFDESKFYHLTVDIFAGFICAMHLNKFISVTALLFTTQSFKA